ncbi:hypothetical protein JNB91_22060 [Rhizobium wenxiniae]|uniref:hypothetical protein n=1 Tax=Rhizobium wenxiniae TaxID=1737357 RepID=UPI001C6E07AB|nr:hypothetical protein [Rhizobium wenxiniae]MBW9090504.1 hypothetical protein [Rhizobium wenxiniae]
MDHIPLSSGIAIWLAGCRRLTGQRILLRGITTLQMATGGEAIGVIHPDDAQNAGDQKGKNKDKQPAQRDTSSISFTQ